MFENEVYDEGDVKTLIVSRHDYTKFVLLHFEP